MSKGKKILEVVLLCLLAFIILYTVFLWKYVLVYIEAEEPDEPEAPAESAAEQKQNELPGGDRFSGEPEVTV